MQRRRTATKLDMLSIAGAILESPANDQAWSDAFAALLRCVPADFAAMLDTRLDAGSSKALLQVRGAEHEFSSSYRGAMGATPAPSSAALRGRLLEASGCLRYEQLPRTEQAVFHACHSRLQAPGDVHHGLCAIRSLRDGGLLHFWLLRSRGPVCSNQERAACDEFVRIAAYALQQRLLLDRLERERAIGIGLAENSGDAIFALDAHGRVAYLNAAAQSWLEQDAVVRLQAGHLHFRTSADDAWLQRETAALLPHAVSSMHESLRYRRVCDGGHGVRLYAVLSRLPMLTAPDARPSRPHVALYLRCVEEALPQLRQQDLAELFGFTVTETRVVNALLLGITVEQMAQQWGIRSDTVRGHLKRILAKSDCSRQQELVQVLTKALPHLILMNDHHD